MGYLLAALAIGCLSFCASGDRSLREHDEYWAQKEWEEEQKLRNQQTRGMKDE